MDRRSFLAGAGASVAALALPPVAAAESVRWDTTIAWVCGDHIVHISPGPHVVFWSEQGDYETWSPSAT